MSTLPVPNEPVPELRVVFLDANFANMSRKGQLREMDRVRDAFLEGKVPESGFARKFMQGAGENYGSDPFSSKFLGEYGTRAQSVLQLYRRATGLVPYQHLYTYLEVIRDRSEPDGVRQMAWTAMAMDTGTLVGIPADVYDQITEIALQSLSDDTELKKFKFSGLYLLGHLVREQQISITPALMEAAYTARETPELYEAADFLLQACRKAGGIDPADRPAYEEVTSYPLPSQRKQAFQSAQKSLPIIEAVKEDGGASPLYASSLAVKKLG